MKVDDLFLPPPYTYVQNVDVSTNNWDKPNNVVVCEIRCVAPACDTNFTLKIDAKKISEKNLPGRGDDIWRILVERIYRYGTTSDIRVNCITVYGYYQSDLVNY